MESLITKLCKDFSSDLYFAAPVSSLQTNEIDLVRGVLHMLQGLSSSSFYWDEHRQIYSAKTGIYVSHLSLTSLQVILNQFTYTSTCLKLVENVVNKVERFVRSPSPTLRAFSCSISAWLKRLRDIALKEEENIATSRGRFAPTLLGLASSLSSLCSGADFLLQIVNGAIPKGYLKLDSSVPAAEIAVHILDYLYKKINEICSVQGGEEDAYRMLLYIFVGSLLPYIEGLDSWLFEGTLDDPFEEMFFYANREISVHDANFWEKSYLLRIQQRKKLEFASVMNFVPSLNEKKDTGGTESISLSSSVKGTEQNNRDHQIFPLFIKELAHAVVSAGKSLQLIRHAPNVFSTRSGRRENPARSNNNNDIARKMPRRNGNDGLTLSEVFCVSLVGLIGHGDHISKYFWQDEPLDSKVVPLFIPSIENHKLEEGSCNSLPTISSSEKAWYKLLVDTLSSNRKTHLEFDNREASLEEENIAEVLVDDFFPCLESFCPENPVITVCRKSLRENKKAWGALNLSNNIYLPPLDDDNLRNAIFGGEHEPEQANRGTNYAFGFQFGESERLRSQEDTKILEALLPFPTLLPSFQEKLHMSEFLPFQRNSTLPSRVLSWIQSVELKVTPLPVTLLQECLIIYIKKQVDYIGRNMLSKLLCEWRLMDELGVLRAIYLLGSGDLLQHFLTVTFDKLDTGESWEDDFELNMILQESITNSTDGTVLSAPDSLVVSITKGQGLDSNEQHNAATLVSTPRISHGQNFGIDGLDSLTFSYKVPWPLELIVNAEALKKYNQVMIFLLKVKRAKFVLDKARRWMWKRRGSVTISSKRHWLVEQKLLHFVDAFHQYVMDRVYHSAWRELCEGMTTAASLDEVIEVHEAYLLLIQRQCFVVPDKLWALIASRINSILGLALDFYSIQQTLNSGGAISTVKARCEMEVDRIEKQFDDCIAFLLKVLSFKLNVGHFPHLADLVTRINYNYYYMSDNGTLTTAPGRFETASKLGKTFNVRPN